MTVQERSLAPAEALEGELTPRGDGAGLGLQVTAVPVNPWLTGWGLFALRLLILAGLLAAWQSASVALRAGFWVSTPSNVAARLWEWTSSGDVFFHVSITLQETIVGFLIGSTTGICVGLILGQSPTIGKLIDPFIMAIYSLPKIALAPLLVLWFGIGMNAKIALSAITVFFLVFFNTYSGVRDVDRELIDVIRVMRGNRWHILREVVLPSALTWVFSGLRISVPYALIGAVTGEIITSNRGMGFLISRSAGMLDTTGVFAGLFVLTIVAVLLNAGVAHAETRMLRWKAAGR